MGLGGFVTFGLLMLVVLTWWQARGFKALALRHAAVRCRDLDLQLLDQSVVLQKTRLARKGKGLYWRRTYDFEFSSTGVERYHGSLELLGSQLQSINLDVHVTH